MGLAAAAVDNSDPLHAAAGRADGIAGAAAEAALPDGPGSPSVTDDGAASRATGPTRLDLATLYTRHFDYVWHAVRRLGGRDGDLEDLVHDVFMTLWRTLDRYDPRRPIKPWLYGIAFRVVSDYRRRARFSREIPASQNEAFVADTRPAPLAEVEQRERRRLVAQALEALGEQQRVVFVMVEIEGYSVVEVSEALGLKLNTAYSRLRLARTKFTAAVKRVMLQRGDEP
jgi:RNA polymerase sigma-70 factor, ECF subfamily